MIGQVAAPSPADGSREAGRKARGEQVAGTRFPAVDGLRGVAILSVLLYHTNWFTNGLFGVDAFFVLSGFLVTLLLIREMERTGHIALGRFFRRRFKRLMPGLAVTLGLVVALGYLLSPLREAIQIKNQGLAALFQVANWAQIARGDAYWDQSGAISPFSAMWSLSITEQFYVVWPIVLVIAFFVFRRRVLPVAVLTALLFAASAAVAPVLWNGDNSDRLYLATHTRAVAFMAGALAAFVVHLAQRRLARREAEARAGTVTLLNVLAVVTFVAVVYCSVKVKTYHDPWLYKGGLAIVATLVAVLTAALCVNRGPVVKTLSYPLLAEVGQISYSMYLLHLPVYWLLLQAWPDLKPYALFVMGAGATWLLAMIMHYQIEQFRHRDWRPSRAVPLFSAASLAIGAGAYYLPTYIEHQMRPGGKQLVLTLGDSMAEDFATTLAKYGGRYAVVDGGQGGCGVMSPEQTRDRVDKVLKNWDACRDWPTFWKNQLDDSQPDAVLIHLGWDATEQQVGGKWLSPCDAAYRTRYLRRLSTAVGVVTASAPRAKVLLMNERRVNGAITADWGICFDKVVAQYAHTAPRSVTLVDLDHFLCAGEDCRTQTDSGKRLYPDGDGVHLTHAGMGYLAPWLQDRISAVLPAPAKKK